MSFPERIQLKRTKGWRKPENTVVVARPSKWGNPFTLGGRDGLARWPGALTGLEWEYENRVSANGMQHNYYHADGRITWCKVKNLTRQQAVALFRECLTGEYKHYRSARISDANLFGGEDNVPSPLKFTQADLAELRGKNLACWCPLNQPCHADLLLEMANQ